MTKAKKGKIKIIAAGFLAILIIGGVIFAMNISSVAKTLAENIASQSLGVKVKIDDMQINIQERKISLTGINVGNPRGYSAFENALELSSVSIDMDSFENQLLKFDSIKVGNTDVFFEVNNKGSNLGVIKEFLNAKSANKMNEDKAQEAIKVIIRKLNLGKSTMHAHVAVLKNDDLKVAIPSIALSGIGERSNGVLARDAIGQVMDKVINVSSRAAAKQGMLDKVGAQQLESLNLTSGLTSGLQKNTGGTAKQLKGLLSR